MINETIELWMPRFGERWAPRMLLLDDPVSSSFDSHYVESKVLNF